jgi:hypothetical protein
MLPNVPESKVRAPVIRIIPKAIKSIPLMRLTHGSHLRNFWKPFKNLSSASVETINGIAKPAEYMTSSIVPCETELVVAARVSRPIA